MKNEIALTKTKLAIVRNVRGCEMEVMSRCNLSCASCFHHASVAQPYSMDPEEAAKITTILALVYKASFVKLLGGEPLLNPWLADIAKVIRASGVTKQIVVATNGVLLHRMKPAFWQAVDTVDVSMYPGFELTADELKNLTETAAFYDTELLVYRYKYFRTAYALKGTCDDGLVRRIYSTCKMAHVWRCHTLADEVFYKCPPAAYLRRRIPELDMPVLDGVKIVRSREFRNEFDTYIVSKQPLAACRYCLGTVGKKIHHRQCTEGEWREIHDFCTEDLVDYEYLSYCERNPDDDSSAGCKERLDTKSGIQW